MDDSSDLPPLPDYAKEFRPRWPGDKGGFTADQMQAYARAAVEAEREACANECAKVYHQHIGPQFGEVRYGVAACQNAIRSRGKP